MKMSVKYCIYQSGHEDRLIVHKINKYMTTEELEDELTINDMCSKFKCYYYAVNYCTKEKKVTDLKGNVAKLDNDLYNYLINNHDIYCCLIVEQSQPTLINDIKNLNYCNNYGVCDVTVDKYNSNSFVVFIEYDEESR